MTTAASQAGLTAAEAADLPLGRLLSREQVLLWLGCTEQDLDQAVADGQILAVQYTDRREEYPQVQFSRPRCSASKIAVALTTFAALDPSGALAACWLARRTDLVTVYWRGAQLIISDDGPWPTITATSVRKGP